jgi:tRNA1Val (adenine37-N6)-methyltransferase
MNDQQQKYRFRFKQFGVNDDKCAMKIGTDGVLLGAWCDISSANNILDIGSGSGLISLMIAQRCNALITGVEIDSSAVEQSIDNINSSPWNNRINIVNNNFIDWAQDENLFEKFDHIVSNPPFFNSGPIAPSSIRAMARHENSLSYEQLIKLSVPLLTSNGKISIISPIERKNDITYYCEFYRLNTSRITLISSKHNASPNRILWEFSKQKCATIQEHIYIRDENNQYSEDYITLTKDFYLIF